VPQRRGGAVVWWRRRVTAGEEVIRNVECTKTQLPRLCFGIRFKEQRPSAV